MAGRSSSTGKSRKTSSSASPKKSVRSGSALRRETAALDTITSTGGANRGITGGDQDFASCDRVYNAKTPFKFTPEKDVFAGTYEFGGWMGALAIMVLSHVLVFYAFICIDSWGGEFVYAGHPKLGGKPFFATFAAEVVAKCTPTAQTLGVYLAFLTLEWLMNAVMPGINVPGRSVPSENGYRHIYKCNGYSSWFTLLAVVAGLYKTNTWSITHVAKNYGRYLASAVLVADVIAVVIFVWGIAAKRAVRMTGNVVYDFFMGSVLNAKLPLGVDFKMLAELRISWGYLFMITLSHAVLQYETYGKVTPGMALLVFAHFIYAHACHKGEECVTACWDIYHEKFGWMLIFWNLAGVPVFYGINGAFILKVRPTYEHPMWQAALIFVVLCGAYYIFDTAGSQKNRFRMVREGTAPHIIHRKTFPQFAFGFIADPKTIKAPGGKELFIDGWFAYARKINYTADSTMAFCWGAVCGVTAPTFYFIPFLYWAFHFAMLLHRVTRDEHLMAVKYGKLWDKYIQTVPYRFIPGVI